MACNRDIFTLLILLRTLLYVRSFSLRCPMKVGFLHGTDLPFKESYEVFLVSEDKSEFE
jgi:hypothetical protein